jgi:hypothetical protein
MSHFSDFTFNAKRWHSPRFGGSLPKSAVSTGGDLFKRVLGSGRRAFTAPALARTQIGQGASRPASTTCRMRSSHMTRPGTNSHSRPSRSATVPTAFELASAAYLRPISVSLHSAENQPPMSPSRNCHLHSGLAHVRSRACRPTGGYARTGLGDECIRNQRTGNALAHCSRHKGGQGDPDNHHPRSRRINDLHLWLQRLDSASRGSSR